MVTYTAKVSPAPTGGTVQFSAAGKTLSGCGADLVVAGKARCAVTYSAVGTQRIVAAYSGVATYAASKSRTLSEKVVED